MNRRNAESRVCYFWFCHSLMTWALWLSLTLSHLPQPSMYQECLVFSHSQSFLQNILQAFDPLTPWNGRCSWDEGPPEWDLSPWKLQVPVQVEAMSLGIFCWVLHAEPPMYCKYVSSPQKAVFSIAHVPKYALYRCTACDFNNSQSLFLVLGYWLNSKGSIYIKDQILKILGRTLGYLFWNLIEISVMLFTDEKPNRYTIALYCEMKPSREESKTLIFF